MRKIALVLLLFTTSHVIAAGISLNNKGELLVNNKSHWSFKEFESIGYKIKIDRQVYMSEGVFSDSNDDYDVIISKGNKVIVYFEVRDKLIWRGNLLSPLVPISTNKSDEVFTLGMSLSKAINYFGSYKKIGSGHEIGTYLTFKNYKESSFHTKCSFFYFEQTEIERKMSNKQLNDYCKIDSMHFFGNKRLVKNSDFK